MHSNQSFPHTRAPLFSENPLDRMDHLRETVSLNVSQHVLGQQLYLVFHEGKLVLENNNANCFLSGEKLNELSVDSESMVFLGGDGSQHYFAINTNDDPTGAFDVMGMRTYVNDGYLADTQLGIIAEGASLLKWHQSHGFCARCGEQTRVAHGGWRRDCRACDSQHFPRTDPVAIMLVTHGDHCLLGRGHQFEEQRFSCLAGFLEPGETMEAAALRELYEEAGVRGTEVRYLCSQPWPFVSNLMMGMHVIAEDRALTIDENELAEAIWVSKADVAAVLDGATDREFLLPPRIAIARDLLEIWVAE